MKWPSLLQMPCLVWTILILCLEVGYVLISANHKIFISCMYCIVTNLRRMPVNYRCMIKPAIHSASPSYFGPSLSPNSCSYSTWHSYPDRHYLTVLSFHSSLFKSVKHFGHSFAFDAPNIWIDLPDMYTVQHQLPPSGKTRKLTCLQKPICHSIPVTPLHL